MSILSETVTLLKPLLDVLREYRWALSSITTSFGSAQDIVAP